MTETVNGATKKYTYTYNEDNQLISETVGDVVAGTVENAVTVTYTYDGFGRLTNRALKSGETVLHNNGLRYSSGSTLTTSHQICTYNGIEYYYDENGNITSIIDGEYTTNYVYDSANQLIWEYNEEHSFAHHWEYDSAGNIRKRVEYGYSDGELSESFTAIEYEYNSTQWGDLLTLYDYEDRIYDAIGNLVDDEEWEYTWQHGRQLASMSKGNTTWTYTYGADGLRTNRTNGIETYTYVYNGSQLTRLLIDGPETVELYFTYDATGTPLTLTANGYLYYYATNLQGDVIGIRDSNGQQIATYAYDAWGNILYSTNSPIADYNPLRYRGYVYDAETGLYYLQSRYYNPEWGRFITLDNPSFLGIDGLASYNLFSYCGNNPVMGYDPTGCWDWKVFWDVTTNAAATAAACAVGFTVGLCTYACTGSIGAAVGAGTIAATATYGAVNNTVNVIYYNHISDGKADLGPRIDENGKEYSPYVDEYITRWDRLDYAKQETQEENYNFYAWYYQSEYSVHMYGWDATDWAHTRSVPLISDWAERFYKLDIAAHKLDRRWYVVAATFVWGAFGL